MIKIEIYKYKFNATEKEERIYLERKIKVNKFYNAKHKMIAIHPFKQQQTEEKNRLEEEKNKQEIKEDTSSFYELF